MNKSRLVIVFVKNPLLGSVKTRLAETIGNSRALEVYEQLLVLTAAAASAVQAHRKVWYSDSVSHNDQFDNNLFDKDVQHGNDLGERMLHSVASGFEAGYQHIVVIGSDCPEVTGELLEKAFTSLNEMDVVIGPSKDGGYYLIGFSQYVPAVFKNISWSTPDVFSTTLDILKRKGLSVAVLEELNDIDTEEDLNQSRLSLG